MPQDNNIKELIINQLTKAQYKELKDADLLSNTELYIITDNANYTEDEILTLLGAKQNKLIAGDGVTIENDIITINLDDFYTSNAIDELLKEKSDISQTGYNLDYTDNILTIQNINGGELSSVRIVSAPELDNVTINLNNSNQLQSIGEITRNGTPKYTWIGTQEEYNQAKLNGIITELTEVIITDSEAETITPIAQYDAPTKLSELANDMNFVVQSDLQSVKNELQADIEAGIDDTNLVHKTGNETIEGFKNFKEKIVIENGLNKGRIAHKPIGTSLEDGYIEFGDNILLYGKQNINGELFDEKHNIFHDGNLVAGDNITIIEADGIYTIHGEAGGGTGDSNYELPIASTSTLGGVKVDGDTINITQEGVISANIIKSYNDLTDKPTIPSEYILPTASTDILGGVKVDGETITILNGIISAVSASGGGWEFAKGTNSGYLKHIDSGLTIQFGRLTLASGSPYGSATSSTTFPTPFTTTNISVTTSFDNDMITEPDNNVTINVSGISIKHTTYAYSTQMYYIAMGY